MPATPKVKSRVAFENIAYRGASGLAPENTLRACDIALRKGATVIDVNVRLSADGVPVLFHDEEVARKTTGRGPIAKLSLKEIRKLRITGGRGRRLYEEPIATLEEAILLLRGRGEMALELMGDDDLIVEKVLHLAAKYELPPTTTILAHRPKIYESLRAARPPYRTGRVLAPKLGWQGVVEAVKERPQVLAVHRSAASAKVLAICREARVRCWIYTIEHQKEFQRAIALRPDGLMTTFPGRLRRLVVRQKEPAAS